jgi:hypothetical protein
MDFTSKRNIVQETGHMVCQASIARITRVSKEVSGSKPVMTVLLLSGEKSSTGQL